MSSFDDIEEREDLQDHKEAKSKHPKGRVVTDAVHSRFRVCYVYCETCKMKFVSKRKEILKHFDSSHPPDKLCEQCQKNVFKYTEIGNEVDPMHREHYYYTCKH